MTQCYYSISGSDAFMTNKKNKRFTLRMPEEIADKLDEKAKKLGVSKNALILFTVGKELNNEADKKDK